MGRADSGDGSGRFRSGRETCVVGMKCSRVKVAGEEARDLIRGATARVGLGLTCRWELCSEGCEDSRRAGVRLTQILKLGRCGVTGKP